MDSGNRKYILNFFIVHLQKDNSVHPAFKTNYQQCIAMSSTFPREQVCADSLLPRKMYPSQKVLQTNKNGDSGNNRKGVILSQEIRKSQQQVGKEKVERDTNRKDEEVEEKSKTFEK